MEKSSSHLLTLRQISSFDFMWNPSPKVADCRDIATKWKKDQVIIISLDDEGRLEMATFGKTKQLCHVTGHLGNVAFEAIEKEISDVDEIINEFEK